ncbi:MAG: hypothetical protein ACO1N0_10290 [Fluviicola sp.]
MKSKFTTSGTELIRQVKAELFAPYSEKSSLLFTCFPALGLGNFSIQFIEEVKPFLIVRQWRPENSSYSLGVHLYDLNNTYIGEKRIALSEEDCSWIREIKNCDLSIGRSDGIMLDGAEYSLTLQGKTVSWTLIDIISPELENALKKLSAVSGLNFN